MTALWPTIAVDSAMCAVGLQTAFIHRPMEYGGAPAPDLQFQQPWDYEAGSLIELAERLGC